MPDAPPPIDEPTLVAADRWRLWSSLLRGLSHQLANVAQMLALEPVPGGAIAESRERITETMAALHALREPSGNAPTLLAPVLDDLDRLQRLQMEFPSAPITCRLEPGIPALAVRPDDLLHVLLAWVTAHKRLAGSRRVALELVACEDGEGASLRLAEAGATERPQPGEAVLALLARMGGRATSDGALWLPAWRRPAGGR